MRFASYLNMNNPDLMITNNIKKASGNGSLYMAPEEGFEPPT